jgi:hypothetical protein
VRPPVSAFQPADECEGGLGEPSHIQCVTALGRAATERLAKAGRSRADVSAPVVLNGPPQRV